MPSIQKMLFFLSSALATAISVGLLGYGMSAQWATTTMKCARQGSGNFNGTAEISLGLFEGRLVRTSCPLFGSSDIFQVFSALDGTPIILHGLVLTLLALSLLFSACNILVSLYNSVSNPYETIMGPTGIYVCSSLSAFFSFAALVLYVVNVTVTTMAEDLVRLDNIDVELREKTSLMQLGYFLVVPYTVLCFVSIGVIFFYDHAAYTLRKEQQRPTEDAPKEIMMY